MHIRWRGLELPSVVTCDAHTLSPTYGKFTAEPFELGHEASTFADNDGAVAILDQGFHNFQGRSLCATGIEFRDHLKDGEAGLNQTKRTFRRSGDHTWQS